MKIGSKVWYRPEKKAGTDKLAPEWKGPAVIVGREGTSSYLVELKAGTRQPAHRSQLKPHVEDTYGTKPYPLYYHHGKAPEVAVGPDEYEAEEVLKTRTKADGTLEALVRWSGYKELTWEPMLELLNPALREFAQEHGLSPALVA